MVDELIWTIAAFTLTLLVFSFLLGDNPLFRIAIYAFIGVAAGYASVIIVYQVILPRLVWPLFDRPSSESVLILTPTFLSLLLLAKLFPRLSKLGNVPLAFLAGVGSAIAIGGAIMGTIVPLIGSSFGLMNRESIYSLSRNDLFRQIEGVVVLFGTITTLAYFQFGAKSHINQQPSRPKWVEGLAFFGKIFIGVILGALFAGVYLATLAALIERLDFVRNIFFQLIFMLSSFR